MKKHLLILATVFLSISTFSQIPNYVPANGLVGWWPFNGNANDESGNGNHGTVNGATLTQDRFGNTNMAYGFMSGSINMNNLSISLTNNYSISFWAKPINYLNGYTVAFELTQNFNCNDNPLIGFWDNNLIYHTCSDIYTNVAMGNFNQIQGQWIHLTITMNNGLISTFKNGIFYASGTIIWPNIITDKLTIGNSGNGLSNPSPFKGLIDDFAIWNYPLNQCEIQDLYNAQLGSQAISAGADQSICSGDPVTLNGSGGSSYQWNNNVVDGQAFTPNQSANYVVNGTDSLGCQGTDTVVVTVLENAVSTLTQTALDSYTLNGQTYTQSGTYTQTVPAANGCDSTITLNLTLNFTGMDELGTGAKKLVKITDLNGKIIPRRKNTLMLFIYEDGTVERVVEMD
jgi:hypothetical protein